MRVVALGLIGFGLCMGVAVGLYPGGTWSDPSAAGHSFWRNFWCDLLDPVAIGGGDNRWGAGFARAAFVSFALALLRFWPLAAAFAGNSARARWAARLGLFGAVGLVAVTTVSSATSPVAHGVAVALAALAGLGAALLLMPQLSPRSDRPTRLLGLGLALSSSVTLGQYLRQGISAAYYADWLPGAQKLATCFLLLWMLRLLWLMRRAESG